MNEYTPKPSQPGASERGNLDANKKFPSPEELKEFEAVQNGYLTMFDQPIEHFARDPEHPTEDEVQLMKDYNDANRIVTPPSFEDYFGYPDPRTPDDTPDDSPDSTKS
jgi:hypothetical protein